MARRPVVIGIVIAVLTALSGLLAPPAAAVTVPQLGPTQRLVSYPYYGKHGTLFLRYCGGNPRNCGDNEIVAVNDDGLWGIGAGPGYAGPPVKLAEPFYGQLGTYADFSTDRLFAVNRDAIYSKYWLGANTLLLTGFAPTVKATTERFYGNVSTAFAEVTGDNFVDAIAVNRDGIFVKAGRANGTFGPTTRWTTNPYYGTRGTYFVDVNGDYVADAVVVNPTGTTVRLSTRTSFGAYGPTQRALTAASRVSFANFTNSAQSMALWFSPGKVYAYPANGTGFDPPQAITTSPYYGEIDSLGVLLNSGGTSPSIWGAVVVNHDGIAAKMFPYP